jgi:hypothetical protein
MKDQRRQCSMGGVSTDRCIRSACILSSRGVALRRETCHMVDTMSTLTGKHHMLSPGRARVRRESAR